MSKKFKNALYINFTNLFFSEAMKLIMSITLLISIAFNFWPLIYRVVLGNKGSYTFESGIFVVFGICTVFMFFIVMIITRVGAQIGFQKGSKETEIILTSISKHQLYMAHVLSSIGVTLLVFFIVFIPFLIAGWVKNPEIVINITSFSYGKMLFVLAHALFTSFVLIILAINVTSIVKRSEDTGPYLLIVLIPFLLSNIYFVINNDMYQGAFFVFNFIPITSMISATGVCLLGSIDGVMKLWILLTDVVWIGITYFIGRKCFEKNISI